MDWRKNRTRVVGVFVAGAGILAAALTITWAGRVNAQELPRREDKPEAVVQVGTYEPQRAFEQYPGQKKLVEAYQAAQAGMAKAQEAGDQGALEQIQQQLEQTQQEVIGQFQRDVEALLPDAARAAQVQVIAREVVYTAEGVNVKDVTPHIAKGLIAKAEGEPEERRREVPAFPRE